MVRSRTRPFRDALVVFGYLCVVPLAAMETPPSSRMLDALTAEAAALKKEVPDRWRQYEESAAEVFTENQRATAGWKKRYSPPAPNLAPLKLPLAFLADLLLSEPAPVMVEETLDRGAQHDRRLSALRHHAYLMAMVRSDDERRIAALCDYRDREQPNLGKKRMRHAWHSILAEAANLSWAVEQIEAIAPHGMPAAPIEQDLIYCLGKRFAAELPPDARDAAYDYLASYSPDALSSYPYHPWDVLFRLDTGRARKAILPYYDKTVRDHRPTKGKGRKYPYRLSVIHLLHEHAGESPEVAAAVRQWLAAPGDMIEFDKRFLRVVLLRADPVHELEPAVRRVDQLVAEQERRGERFEFGGDIHALVGAMTKIGSPAADREVCRYVRERAIDAGVRLLLLESLVRRHHEKSPDLMAHWIREESEPWPEHLRKEAAERWDEFGRQALAKAEQLDFQPSD